MNPPTPPNEPYLRFTALGGLGEVGMNCSVYEADGRLIVVDCGVTFPESMHYGIDLIIPDFEYLRQRKNDIEALLLTHGHMDHIGAIPWFLQEFNVPIYGPAFAIELLRSILDERGLLDNASLHVVDEESVEVLGPFEAEFPAVNHSIPHAHAIVLRTSTGTYVHSGDFKIDHQPVLEEPFQLNRYTSIGNEGVRALFSDSTNAQRPGSCPSERSVQSSIHEVVRDCKGRVFAAMFSSNVFRAYSFLEAAAKTGRKVCILGRSLRRSIAIARQTGLIPESLTGKIVDIKKIGDIPDQELMFLCTGSQAEPRAALSRLARGDDSKVTLKPSDTIIFSARVIPGNEHWVYKLYDQLERQKVTVITPDSANVHCSGHGYQEDMRLMIRLLEPTELVPVHGDHRYQRAHAKIGQQAGVSHTWVLDNGDMLEFTAHDTKLVGHVPTGRFLIDGEVFDDVEGEFFRQRRQIARCGVVMIHMLTDAPGQSLQHQPEAQQLGAFAPEQNDHSLLEECQEIAADTYQKTLQESERNLDYIAEMVRRDVRRHLRRTLSRKPLVVVRIQTNSGSQGEA